MRMDRSAVALLAVCTVFAQGDPQQRGRNRTPTDQPAPPAQAEPAQAQPARRAPLPEEKSSVTHHSARIGGQQINYTATAATYIVKADDGTPKASFFFVAYTKDDVPDASKRPLSIVYNGGPGSGSLFTHIELGTKRNLLPEDESGLTAHYTDVEYNDSIIVAADLVFMDAICTDFS